MKKHKDARSLNSKTQEIIRKKAVFAVIKGLKQVKASSIFGITRQAIGRWIRAYKKNGARVLISRKRGRPKGKIFLKGWQAASICNIIRDHKPEQLKFPFFLWTAAGVRDLIKKKYKIFLSIRTVQRYLKEWGFTPQKPINRAYERNPYEVRKWLRKTYPAIKMMAKRLKFRIFWLDEMGMRSDHQVGRTYSPRGSTPEISGTGKRFGCNMISTISNKGELSFMIYKGRFESKLMIEFLCRLLKQYNKNIFLIADRHPVHLSKALKNWEQENSKRIRLFHLPAYCPELNPDEMLNNDVKSNSVGKQRPKDLKEMQHNIYSFLRRRQARPKMVINYFHAPTVLYAAD